MKCIICNSESSYFFSKIYSENPFDKLMRDIGKVDYYKCTHCGFVLSKTHSELDEGKWGELNREFHHYMESTWSEKKINQPSYAEQAMMLSLLGTNGVIRTDNMIDYAAGYGTLSAILAKYHDLELSVFDPYVHADNSSRYVDEKELKTYKTVVNSAMFEHVLRREDLDRVNAVVAGNGCLVVHTVVCENVPQDPDWFYLRPPVHTAFHTNKSMGILMDQWGYRSSIYCPQSKCWVLLRTRVEAVEKIISTLNQELQNNWFYCKNGFFDYWKGF